MDTQHESPPLHKSSPAIRYGWAGAPANGSGWFFDRTPLMEDGGTSWPFPPH